MNITQSIDIANKEKKSGISGWMVHNIERLNEATDFEQYAHSPPESEGFLADPLDNADITFSTKITDEQHYNTSKLSSDIDKIVKQKPQLPELNIRQAKHDNLHKSLLEVLKSDDAIYSSPDSTPYSTPFSTPQPSPAPQRKISFSSQDTVQSNPEKWFYLGGKDKNKLKLLKYKESEKKSQLLQSFDDIQIKKLNEKTMKAKTSVRESHAKLAISNFDLNAISPSSW